MNLNKYELAEKIGFMFSYLPHESALVNKVFFFKDLKDLKDSCMEKLVRQRCEMGEIGQAK